MPLSMEEFDELMMSNEPDLQFSVDIPAEMLEAMTAGGTLAPRIPRNQALQVPAVLRSRNLICSTLAGLPIHMRDKQHREVDRTPLLIQIDPDVPNIATFSETYEDLLFEGVSWWRVLGTTFEGYPSVAEHIAPGRVMVTGGTTIPIVDQNSRT